jgi:hypothetical protein
LPYLQLIRRPAWRHLALMPIDLKHVTGGAASREQTSNALIDQPQQSVCRTEAGDQGVSERVWLVTFVHYDLGFFDQEYSRLECAENPFDAKPLPI